MVSCFLKSILLGYNSALKDAERIQSIFAAKEKTISKQGVSVVTTARLHMGFFDLNGGLGRKFGSLGVSLDKPSTSLYAYLADRITANGPGAERALKTAMGISRTLELPHGFHIEMREAIPEHAGLGSGTQMSLAVGAAISTLFGLDLGVREIAVLTSRGARSGIGLGTFATGGVIVDGGRAADTDVPPVIARAEFPPAWRILLMFDRSSSGVHGAHEIAAFRQLPEFPADSAAELCRYVLMQALPALAEHDLPAFGKAIRQLQWRTGDHFAPAQGGRYASPLVSSILQQLESQGVDCLGQSSWGPTGFAIFADETDARQVLEALESQFCSNQDVQFLLCKGYNSGAEVSSCSID
ncbi:GHMP kinase [Methylobacillus caricis]|uniref:beta-ribofuranosylaminobenzene 5'-phosphate synthase family protein n=1 Tax=Methylobacillus caricis TaxID=1971611 RepID=UPI001CFF967D|nr:beta-ribofuranosylaminobenzene 5'-phosphate synthase family protein [Methylobacillus caricis]MCB5187274.1 GHMP kinase [Methylobacillus caricis]